MAALLVKRRRGRPKSLTQTNSESWKKRRSLRRGMKAWLSRVKKSPPITKPSLLPRHKQKPLQRLTGRTHRRKGG